MRFWQDTLHIYLFATLLLFSLRLFTKTTLLVMIILRFVFTSLEGEAMTYLLTFHSAEHPINQLADCSFQASSYQLIDRMACGIPSYGSAVHRLRKRRFHSLRRPSISRYSQLRHEPLYPHFQGEPYFFPPFAHFSTIDSTLTKPYRVRRLMKIWPELSAEMPYTPRSSISVKTSSRLGFLPLSLRPILPGQLRPSSPMVLVGSQGEKRGS